MDDVFKYDSNVQAESYDDYLAKCEEKWRRVSNGEEPFYGGSEVNYYIYDIADAMKIKPADTNLRDILNEFIKGKGKEVVDGFDKRGVFKGINLTHEDYYYILTDGERDWYESCVGGLKYL